MLEAHGIGQHLHTVKQGIDIPMDVPFGGALRSSPDHRGPCQIALADIEAWRDANPAEIGEAPGLHGDVREPQIGRASCRERVCQYVSISVVAVALKKKERTQSEHQKTNKKN